MNQMNQNFDANDKIKLTGIIKISPKKYRLCFSNGYTVEIPLRLLIKLQLSQSTVFDTETYINLKSTIQFDIAETVIVNKLKARKHSEFELRSELTTRGIDENIIDSMIEKYKRLRYIDDADFARSYISDKMRFNYQSLNRIKNELTQKKIDSAIIEESIAEIENSRSAGKIAVCEITYDNNSCQNLDYDTCLKLIHKKQKKYQNYKTDRIIRDKLVKYLLYKGFDYDIIKKALESE